MSQRQRLSILSVFLLTLCTHTQATLNYGNCESQFNSSGICLPIADCAYLHEMVSQPDPPPEIEEKLFKSACGRDNTQSDISRIILVCCPTKFNKYPSPRKLDMQPADNHAGDVLPCAGQCGTMYTPYIYGGNETKIQDFPWMALIKHKNSANQFEFRCGGSLINSRYVLTAAHCVQQIGSTTNWTVHSVRLGEWNRTVNPDCVFNGDGKKICAPPFKEILVEAAIRHPDYLPESVQEYNDIALLRLAESVPYTNFIRPICLFGDRDSCNSRLAEGAAMEVAGWGSTKANQVGSEIKMKATVNSADMGVCYAVYRTRHRTIDSRYQVCAGGVDGIDTCRGDSGGPLMLNNRINHWDAYFAVGITSFGSSPCGLPNWPGVYTRLCNYVDWIKATIKP